MGRQALLRKPFPGLAGIQSSGQLVLAARRANLFKDRPESKASAASEEILAKQLPDLPASGARKAPPENCPR